MISNYCKSFLAVWRKGGWVKLKSYGEDLWQSYEKKYSLAAKQWALVFEVSDGELKYVDECRGRKRVYKLSLKKYLRD